MKTTLLFTPALLALSVAATADSNDLPKLEEMIVVADRAEVPWRSVSQSVTVLNQGDIAALGQLNVADALRFVPGVAVTNQGGAGKSTSVRIRGEEGYRTKLLLDGLELSDVAGTQVLPAFTTTNTPALGQIAVLRGPQGLMYGADAGGVVDMSSRRAADEFETSLSAEYGSFDSGNLVAYAGGKSEQVDFSVSAQHAQTEGFNARSTDLSNEKDGNENTVVHGRGTWALSEALSVDAVLRNQQGSTEFDGCFAGVSTDDCVADSRRTDGLVGLNLAGDSFSHEVDLAYSTHSARSVVAGSVVDSDLDGSTQRAQYLGHLDLGVQHQLTLGTEWRNEDVQNNKTQAQDDRRQSGVFAQYRGTPVASFSYSLGLRYDDNQDFGGFTSYRAGAAYSMDALAEGMVKLKASANSGFRVPSLNEIAYNAGSWGPDLLPDELTEETSEGWEAGVEFLNNNGLWLEAVWFDTEIQNEIYFDLNSFAGYQQGNGLSHSRGLELSGQGQLTDNWRLTAGYTYNPTEMGENRYPGVDKNSPRLRRPMRVYRLGTEFESDSGALTMALNYRYASESYDYDWGTGGQVPLDNYGVLNANVQWNLTDASSVYVRVDNALDREYQEVATYNTARRAIYLGAQLNL